MSRTRWNPRGLLIPAATTAGRRSPSRSAETTSCSDSELTTSARGTPLARRFYPPRTLGYQRAWEDGHLKISAAVAVAMQRADEGTDVPWPASRRCRPSLGNVGSHLRPTRGTWYSFLANLLGAAPLPNSTTACAHPATARPALLATWNRHPGESARGRRSSSSQTRRRRRRPTGLARKAWQVRASCCRPAPPFARVPPLPPPHLEPLQRWLNHTRGRGGKENSTDKWGASYLRLAIREANLQRIAGAYRRGPTNENRPAHTIDERYTCTFGLAT